MDKAMASIPAPTNELQTVPQRRAYLSQPNRPRALLGQISLLVMQPGAFFRTLPALHAERTWLWAAILILLLVGFSAVQQKTAETATGADAGLGMGSDIPDFSAPMDGDFGFDPGFMPEIPPGDGAAASGSDISESWASALMAGSGMLLQWFILVLLLCEVTMFNGIRPYLGRNLAIAIWASVPLAFMIVLQLIYQSAGGSLGPQGLSGLLVEAEGFYALPFFIQNVLYALFSHVTLFWLWSLVLLYLGARRALNGKRWAVLLTLAAWVIILAVVPVITGTISAPQPETAEILLPEFDPNASEQPMFDENGRPFIPDSEAGNFSEGENLSREEILVPSVSTE